MMALPARTVVCLCLAMIVATVEAVPQDESMALFQEFIRKFNKTYESAEVFESRFQAFQESLIRIAHQNRAGAESLATFGITKFSDLTVSEFKKFYLLPEGSLHGTTESSHVTHARAMPRSVLPQAFDWRQTPGVVTYVQDQGQCGSCWAFSAVENIESVWALQGPVPHIAPHLSVGQVVDCDHLSHGCNGGDPKTAYNYVVKAHGLESSETYPYFPESSLCQHGRGPKVANITGFERITTTRNETAMQAYLVTQAPLSVCVEADTWMDYDNGIIMNVTGCGTHLDHCVQVTGYNSTVLANGAAVDYWIVRNSWGADWGNGGYLYIQRGYDVCGIAQEVTSAYIR